MSSNRFEVVEAKPWHCGAMVRLLRREHQRAVAMVGLNSHRELRGAFDDSIFRRSWFINGKLAAIGGVTGPALSSYGVIWLAFSEAATRYPLAIVKEMRRQIAEIMRTKRLLICSILEGDEAAERLAIFLGFVPQAEGGYILPASSRFGRLEVARHLKDAERLRLPTGGYTRLMSYKESVYGAQN
jgi:hypothetical protein